MRQIILDTETTGLEPKQGHRILELACVELLDRRLTKRHLHLYINPERESDEGALRVHGITTDFLADKPKFDEIADEFISFVEGAELVIHNAPFDVGFLNAELARAGKPLIEEICPSVLDTLVMAKDLRPGKRNNLDALCRDFGVDNSGRTFHGALLDSELLAEVYLQMTRGQDSLVMDLESDSGSNQLATEHKELSARPSVRQLSEEEDSLHQQYLADLEKANKSPSLWVSLLNPPEAEAV
ncbi:DNA polymerase III subunit epsilon [Leeia sp. TBRC 13508]|uniref:DNA polymerase III subunit epsilon n=1 Tax=Leeia speluncae TaxID=2884804 RepID=A0ABS8D2T0_9NEIS|nr:DNA polymerase III subunit epsilon [Leeia speluncae]MCB6182479.1 DNA polymerase III subunit epsilon [Leeia speluncae]